ncbi:hypothetical protein COCC4DRAFT_68645 [Bipolaris maydis ATCC 48331]|uniref:DUF3328 domain containing protein n=2 Tax=Cochliobolus heterostrophus TaxID=5016 RepID=M2SZC1_COCH5|nr:uncharacterized protein COCC4DRAFT_68645 [Bipolaris maydis ATCC 48331]EMD90725.1 hypothetical protein COCHEDRAFT_1140455 [Bipolaris maydis C5]KAH7555645.1 hypothetical protein BM1_07268 [Bipolaris maydis]ENI09064.1 hypothetical protein COCC4DRAFT_68645 [Bipolaris maydis ATCC 48331]KAJ5023487.1 hypothetical protein J3E73DRAFT_383908 [Bipolaris maydis]KAJ5058577.1 hypothetical protein J3E74DRAFT_275887 [Bipolaris maydis]
MSPFRYSKVSSESSQDSSLEHQRVPPRRNRCCSIFEKLEFLRWPVTFFLLFIILLCELSMLHNRPKAVPVGTDFNSIVPVFSTEKKIFRSDKGFRSDHRTMESVNKTKQQWAELLPLGAGFMEVPDYNSYTLPPPMHFPEAPGKEVFSLAVFHELHCLMHIAASMDDLVMQIRRKDFKLDESFLLHNDHCFDYIRNAIMCFGDTTLEGQTRTPGLEHVPGTDGTGAIHVCRNFDEVSAYAEQKRLNEGREHL